MKSLLKHTGKPYFFFTVMGLCLLGIAASWYRVSQRRDLHGITHDANYNVGVMASMTVVFLAIFLGGTIGLLARRYGPARALPIDPEFPPQEVLYIQGDGPQERCACHGRVIKDGAVVLQWPQPPKFACIPKGHAR